VRVDDRAAPVPDAGAATARPGGLPQCGSPAGGGVPAGSLRAVRGQAFRYQREPASAAAGCRASPDRYRRRHLRPEDRDAGSLRAEITGPVRAVGGSAGTATGEPALREPANLRRAGLDQAKRRRRDPEAARSASGEDVPGTQGVSVRARALPRAGRRWYATGPESRVGHVAPDDTASRRASDRCAGCEPDRLAAQPDGEREAPDT